MQNECGLEIKQKILKWRKKNWLELKKLVIYMHGSKKKYKDAIK